MARLQTAVNENSQIYYSGKYWNDLPRVLEYMCENFTGDKTKWWVQDFKERFARKPFQHGLVLNCGNGWVEREFIDKGIAEQITAFDYSIDLLRLAQKEKGGRPIFYFRTDVNRIDFGEDQFDLVVNVAALHHVQFINRLCRILCKTLTANGILVNFDYIGPHRNQYPSRQWNYIRQVNSTLPELIRKSPLRKPHLPTVLRTDPTEAIHSDLIFESVARYFEISERHDTGGGIAYEILTHNPRVQNAPAADLNPWIDKILVRDKECTDSGQVPPLFSYFIARPNKEILGGVEQMKYFQGVEERREAWARKHRGTYSYRDYCETLLHALYLKLLFSRIRAILAPRLKRFRA